jgi:hypothetical protein
MPARMSCSHALLALVIGCLLFFASPVPTQDGAGSPGTAAPSPVLAGDPLAAPRAAPLHPATYSVRMTGRAKIVTGHGLAPLRSSGVIHAERVASLTDPTSSGPGDHLAVGLAVAGLAVPASRSPRSERAITAACSAPQDTCRARAPPEV